MVLIAALWTSSFVAVSAQSTFFDLSETHWAYASVMELVNDGTVKGYEDGGFHPDGTVTRAEFVKMIGKGDVIRTEPYADVDPSHWGYEYIMASGLQTDGNLFQPDIPITRGEVLELIWTRNGSPAGTVAPAAISGQWKNKDAAAWGYTYKIMIGDDGFNLRLEDPLTRAEAAALIIRGRNYASATPGNFADTVSEDLLKMIIKSSGLVDGNIDDLSAKITNGQMAMAVLRLLYGEDDPMLASYPKDIADCTYGKQWGVVAANYLNTTDYSEQMVNKNAVLSDTLAALSMAAYGKAKSGYEITTSGSYNGFSAEGKVQLGLSVAKGCGVEFYADGSLDGNREVTYKDLGVILIQLDSVIGLKRSYQDTIPKDEKIQKDLTQYPQNYMEYPVILESVPASVYQADYPGTGYTSDYAFAREFYMVFTDALAMLSQKLSTKDYRLKFTYYPSLVKRNEQGYYVIRVYMTKQGNFDGVTYADLFGSQFAGTNQPVKDGFIEIQTATPLNNIVYPAENLIVTQVIQ